MAGYKETVRGLMSKTLDFRVTHKDDAPERRPVVRKGDLYTDVEFPLHRAIKRDLMSGTEWKRPKEFSHNPQLYTEGTTTYDVGQGTAGTCWFLSIVTGLTEKDHMLKLVIPEDAYYIGDQDKYDGVFRARFFRFGQWRDVYIDDKLPVVYGNMLWGASSASDKNEMWVALLEKAFARMYESYDNVSGGQVGDAYLLLTGGVGEETKHVDLNEEEKRDRLFQRISNALKSGCLVGTSVPGKFGNTYGLVGSHAYTVIGTAEVWEQKLLRIRNPWAKGEWTGPWSDGSPEWQTIPDKEVTAPNKNEGEFYISLEDYVHYFSRTTVCALTPDMDLDGIADPLHHVLNIYGEWGPGKAGGYHKRLENPKYCFTVTESCVRQNGVAPIVVQIIQTSDRKVADASIRCDVYRVLGDDQDSQHGAFLSLAIEGPVGQKTNVYTSALQLCFRYRLPPGKYIAVPSTSDPGVHKAMLLRIFSCAPLVDVTEMPDDGVTLAMGGLVQKLVTERQNYDLPFQKSSTLAFVSGVNAGGQVAHNSTFSKNPQFLITVPNTGSEVPIVIHVWQQQKAPKYPVGLRLFCLKQGEEPPMQRAWIYDNYNASPKDVKGKQYKFVLGWEMASSYLLPAGRYMAMVHLDKPNTEKKFCVVFKSGSEIQIRGFQTGLKED